MATVKLGYASSSNITFHGEIDSGIEREDWDEMTEEEQDDTLNDVLNDLVYVYVKDED